MKYDKIIKWVIKEGLIKSDWVAHYLIIVAKMGLIACLTKAYK